MNVMIYFENVPLKITQQSVECLLRTYSKNKTSSQLYNKIRMGKTNILMFGWKKKKEEEINKTRNRYIRYYKKFYQHLWLMKVLKPILLNDDSNISLKTLHIL